mmetsp:Transcript_32826/g.90662  ORF Transcript_32826/g.90662 Transcript_32826/m.90662 type:complete len:288 (+) Transcript_32826:306-1169(+)
MFVLTGRCLHALGSPVVPTLGHQLPSLRLHPLPCHPAGVLCELVGSLQGSGGSALLRLAPRLLLELRRLSPQLGRARGPVHAVILLRSELHALGGPRKAALGVQLPGLRLRVESVSSLPFAHPMHVRSRKLQVLSCVANLALGQQVPSLCLMAHAILPASLHSILPELVRLPSAMRGGSCPGGLPPQLGHLLHLLNGLLVLAFPRHAAFLVARVPHDLTNSHPWGEAGPSCHVSGLGSLVASLRCLLPEFARFFSTSTGGARRGVLLPQLSCLLHVPSGLLVFSLQC